MDHILRKFDFLVQPCINPSLFFLLLICSSFSHLLKKKRIFLSHIFVNVSNSLVIVATILPPSQNEEKRNLWWHFFTSYFFAFPLFFHGKENEGIIKARFTPVHNLIHEAIIHRLDQLETVFFGNYYSSLYFTSVKDFVGSSF